MELERWSSRKLILTGVSILLLIIVPILYQKMGISETITLLVLGSIAGASGVYQIANVMAGKNGTTSNTP